MPQNPKDPTAEAEAAQAALRDSIERARELLCEAKHVIGKDEAAIPIPRKPAT